MKEDVVLVIGPEFSTHGQVISFGPVLCLGKADVEGLGSAQWVMFDDTATVDGIIHAKLIYAAPGRYFGRADPRASIVPIPQP